MPCQCHVMTDADFNTFTQFQLYLWRWALNPLFAECNKHFQWRAERARYPVPRLDVAPMDFISGSSFRSVQRSLFDPKKWSPFPTMVGSLSYPPNNNFWARAMTEGSPRTESMKKCCDGQVFQKENWLDTQRVRASKVVPCPAIAIEFEC